MLKQQFDICSPTVHNLLNKTFHENVFPDELKVADITPIFKKDDSTNVKNYRPVSVLPTVSKIFERVCKKIDKYINKRKSSYYERLL